MSRTVTIFTTPNCPTCHILKKAMQCHTIEFQEIDLSTPDGLTEARCAGIFDLSAPVLKVEHGPDCGEIYRSSVINSMTPEVFLKVVGLI